MVSTLMVARETPILRAVPAALLPAVLLGILSMAARYPCRAMPLRSARPARLAVTHLGAAAVVSGLWLLAWQRWVPVVERAAGPLPAIPAEQIFAVGVILYLGAVAVHYLMAEAEISAEAERSALRYRVLAREAELKAFKAQIDPHFLFNSLNAVASLCGSSPAEARRMAQLLGDFFRLTVRLGKLDRVSLAEEIDLVSGYLAIEKIRFGPRLDSDMEIEPRAAGTPVPPLLLQPLVENAVRHGVASVVEGGRIGIRAATEGDKVRLTIDNPVDPDRSPTRGEGVGLQNVRGRLRAFYDGKATMHVVEQPDRFRVELEIPR